MINAHLGYTSAWPCSAVQRLEHRCRVELLCPVEGVRLELLCPVRTEIGVSGANPHAKE